MMRKKKKEELEKEDIKESIGLAHQ